MSPPSQARTTIRRDLGFRLALIASSWNLRRSRCWHIPSRNETQQRAGDPGRIEREILRDVEHADVPVGAPAPRVRVEQDLARLEVPHPNDNLHQQRVQVLSGPHAHRRLCHPGMEAGKNAAHCYGLDSPLKRQRPGQDVPALADPVGGQPGLMLCPLPTGGAGTFAVSMPGDDRHGRRRRPDVGVPAECAA